MFFLFIVVNSYLAFILYKKYFKIDYLIIIGYLISSIIAIMYNYCYNITDSIIFYYIILLLCLSFIIDIKEMWISDFTIIGILILNIIKTSLDNILFGNKFIYDGIVFMTFIIVIIFLLQIILKKELMGFGDLKLYFVLVINYSFIKVVYLILLSSLIGIIYYYLFKKKNEFPFGPSIIIAYIIIEFI